jgi:outer membrane protein assembly factor BamB
VKLNLRWFLVPLLAVNLAACSTVSGWFGSDDEDPRQPAELEKIQQTVKIRRLWSAGVGDGQGEGFYRIQPAIQGDRIFAASADGIVRAFERSKGKSIWKADLETPLSGGVGVDDNSVFVGSSDGFVIRLDAGSGEQLWQSRLSGEILAAPQGNGSVVVVQTYDGKLQGLDYATGEKLWTYDSNVPVLTIRGTNTPILRDNIVFTGFANGRVVAFDAQTGAVRWEVRVAISQGRSEIERIVDVDGTMVLVGNELYAASYQGRVVAIDVVNGRKIWQRDVSSFSGVSQGFGNIYVADEDGSLTAYLKNGQGIRWTQGALGYRQLSRPTPVSSYVAVADFEGIVHIISQVDGEFAGRVKADSDGVRADMLSDGNVLYVFGNSGKLVAYEITAKN